MIFVKDENRRIGAYFISNAFKFCKTTVFVRCTVGNAKVYIAVSDDGDGIDKVDLPHIFERFYTGKKGNTGIGLALVSEIVKSHGGDIKAYNRNGAVFEITLPKAGDCKKS